MAVMPAFAQNQKIGNLIVDNAATFSARTATRVAFFGTAGLLADSSALAFNSGTGALSATSFSGSGSGLTFGLNVATFLNTPTSLNLANAVTDETGNGSLVFGTAPTITGGALTALTALGLRSTGAAFDLTLATSEVLTAGHTLSFVLSNVDRTLTLSGNPTLSGFTATGTGTLALGTSTLTASNNVTLASDGTGTRTLNIGAGGTLGTGATQPQTVLTGTANQIAVSNSGVGATTVSIPTNPTLSGNVTATGNLTIGASTSSITGAAGNMTITAGTGNSRTLALQSTTSGGVATTFLTGNADQSVMFTSISSTVPSIYFSGLATTGFGSPGSNGVWAISAGANVFVFGPAAMGALRMYIPIVSNSDLGATVGAAGSRFSQGFLGPSGLSIGTTATIATSTDTTSGILQIASPSTGSITLSSGNAIATTIDSSQNQLYSTGSNGQSLNIKHLTELTTIAAAATTDTVIQIPANCIVIGVSVRVVTVIPTAATFNYGVAGFTARYGTGIAVAATTTYPGMDDGTRFYSTAISIRITPNLTPAAATGQVRVTIAYFDTTVPTS